mmetsp:Transcript_6104/g.7316  ORF Transcript_6104/g.7316 Transcript_6104/m.7316 type:complete len:119 (+) Transcript_6104:52-408(+)
MGCLTKGKIIVLRIFQDLMKLDFPIEILDKAVEISAKNVANGTGNTLEAEIAEHLRSTSTLELTNMPFFRLVYSMILQVQQTVWLEREQLNRSRHVLSFELARIFKSLSQNGEKNLFI